MILRFTKYSLLIIAAFAAKASGTPRIARRAAFSQRKSEAGLYHDEEKDNYQALYFFGLENPAQLSRSQYQRTVSFIKGPFVYTNKFRTYFKSLIQIFRHVSEGYVSSCKLILFPFHDFW